MYQKIEKWMPVVGRILFGLLFLNAARYKIPGTESFLAEVNMTSQAGVPLPSIAVFLAFLLELFGGIALLIGWRTRLVAGIFALFVLILNFVFFADLSDPMKMGFFMSNLAIIAGLLYASVYGARHAAVTKDASVDV